MKMPPLMIKKSLQKLKSSLLKIGLQSVEYATDSFYKGVSKVRDEALREELLSKVQGTLVPYFTPLKKNVAEKLLGISNGLRKELTEYKIRLFMEGKLSDPFNAVENWKRFIPPRNYGKPKPGDDLGKWARTQDLAFEKFHKVKPQAMANPYATPPIPLSFYREAEKEVYGVYDPMSYFEERLARLNRPTN